MSHFTVLVAGILPDNVSAAITSNPGQALLAMSTEDMEKQMQIHDANMKLLDSAVWRLVEDQLAPYCENVDVLDYLEFCDMTQEGRTQYESESVDCVRLLDGKVVPTYDSQFSNIYELYKGVVYKRSHGQLHHRKRTKKAKQICVLPNYPYKKLYPSYELFMEEHCGYTFDEQENAYGYYYNPNAKWDWYQIGGRWPRRFLVKNDCALAVNGENSLLFKEAPSRNGPDGYKWVAGARKCDIAWDIMKKAFCEPAVQKYRIYKEWFGAGAVPEKHRDHRITAEGITCWGDLVYHKDETLDDYLQREGLSEEFKYPFSTFAYVSEAGWEGSGDMGWFGMSYNDKDPLAWNCMVEKFIADLPDNAFLVSVDCHI